MAKFKVGDRVRIIKDGTDNLSNHKVGDKFVVAEVSKQDSIWYRETIGVAEGVAEDYLELAGPKTLADVQVGDEIIKPDGKECLVALRSGDIVIYATKCSFGYQASAAYTIAELDENGFAVKQPEPKKPAPVKLTVAQIAEKLGHEVEVIAE